MKGAASRSEPPSTNLELNLAQEEAVGMCVDALGQLGIMPHSALVRAEDFLELGVRVAMASYMENNMQLQPMTTP